MQSKKVGNYLGKISIVEGNAFELPFNDNCFDLIFTSGVLIHIALTDLPRALSEIHRVINRYILAIEYFAEEETSIYYRGHNNALIIPYGREILKDIIF
jgi:ubiquinone/menaquinone biosynthesis C-methylase UbiE